MTDVAYLEDPETYAFKCLKILTKPDDNGRSYLVPMKFNRMQSHFVHNMTNRNIGIKPRQIGFTTGNLAIDFFNTATYPFVHTLLVAHKDDSTKMLLDVTKRFYKHLPQDMKPEVDRDSERRLRFSRLDSEIHIETAGAKIAGRSKTVHRLHLSEISSWEPQNIKELIAGLTETVPSNGVITEESTPKGNSGYLYEHYQAAKRGDIPYKAFFYPWWWDDSYKLSVDNPLVVPANKGKLIYTSDEQILVNVEGLTEDQIRWRRWKQGQLKELFPQEYPENDIDCWLAGGVQIFDRVGLQRQRQYLNKPLAEEENVLYWKKPVGGKRYIIGVDMGRGLAQGDFTVAQVIDLANMEQVAVLRVRINADLFAERLYRLIKEYFTPVIAIENNTGYGDAVFSYLKRQNCPNIFKEENTERPGWCTDTKSRPLMISAMSAAIRSGDITIHDNVTLQEATDFQDIGGKLTVPSGSHDDSLFALMIALAVRQYFPHKAGIILQRAKPIRYI